MPHYYCEHGCASRRGRTGVGGEHAGVHDTAGGRHDLAHATVDGIGVEDHVQHLDTDAAHLLVTERAVVAGALEAAAHGLLDLVEVGHTLGGVEDDVGAGALGAESPDLTGLRHVPFVRVGQVAGTQLEVVAGIALAVLDVGAQLVLEGLGRGVQAVVLVGRLGQARLVRRGGDRLTEGHHGVRDLDLGALHVVLLQVLEADLQVQLTGTGDDVLAGLLGVAEHHGVGLGQALHALHQLGQVGARLGLHGHTHHGRHRELHRLDAVGGLGGGDGTRLEQVLVHTHQSARVT